jgi:hypothetical protein
LIKTPAYHVRYTDRLGNLAINDVLLHQTFRIFPGTARELDETPLIFQLDLHRFVETFKPFIVVLRPLHRLPEILPVGPVLRHRNHRLTGLLSYFIDVYKVEPAERYTIGQDCLDLVMVGKLFVEIQNILRGVIAVNPDLNALDVLYELGTSVYYPKISGDFLKTRKFLRSFRMPARKAVSSSNSNAESSMPSFTR